jgi:hypothetical protein
MNCTPSVRLRWIADFLGVAGKAASVIACVEGIDYSADLHLAAQRDLRAIADQLDTCLQYDPECAAIESTFGAVLRALAELNSADVTVGRLCEVVPPTMELLDASYAIRCALSRLKEWQEYYGGYTKKNCAKDETDQSSRSDMADRLASADPTKVESRRNGAVPAASYREINSQRVLSEY